MNMKVENEMALPITKSVTVMLLEPYAGKLARTVLRGESSRKGADLLDSEQSQRTATNDFCYPGTTAARSSDGDTGTVGTAPFFLTHTCVYI